MDDTQRLAWLLREECVPDGFVHVRLDRYDYAMQVAAQAGREEPTDADCLEGLRRLIDCAIFGGDMPHVMPPNVEFSGVPAGHSSNHPAGGTSAGTQG